MDEANDDKSRLIESWIFGRCMPGLPFLRLVKKLLICVFQLPLSDLRIIIISMRIQPQCLLLYLVFVAIHQAATLAGAQDARFFRIVGPVAAVISELRPDGTVIWTHNGDSATFTVQTAISLDAGANWVDYVQLSALDGMNANRVWDFSPPPGMAFIPAGSFRMGDSLDANANSLPLHIVQVSPFYMDKNEVSKELWDSVLTWSSDQGYSFDNADSGQGKASTHPAQSMTWYDAVKWCNARSQKEGRAPCYYTDVGLTTVYVTGRVEPYVNWSANGYRLPTEAEWEKAARGGASGYRFPWNDINAIQHGRANYLANSGFPYDTSPTQGYHPASNDGVFPYTSPCGSFAANGYGIHNMAGNVHEWCWDWYLNTYYSSSPSTNPQGPASGLNRVLRGGSWLGAATYARSANRYFYSPQLRTDYIGFRCVIAGDPAP